MRRRSDDGGGGGGGNDAGICRQFMLVMNDNYPNPPKIIRKNHQKITSNLICRPRKGQTRYSSLEHKIDALPLELFTRFHDRAQVNVQQPVGM